MKMIGEASAGIFTSETRKTSYFQGWAGEEEAIEILEEEELGRLKA